MNPVKTVAKGKASLLALAFLMGALPCAFIGLQKAAPVFVAAGAIYFTHKFVKWAWRQTNKL